jgi:hypothetical protein
MSNDFGYAATKALSRSRGLAIALFVFALIACIHLFIMSARIEHSLSGHVRSTNKSRALEIVKDGRLALADYLLGGDPRKAEQVSQCTHALDALPASGDPDVAKTIEVYYSWLTDFAEPLIAKRRSLNAGHGTLTELQVAYLISNAPHWDQRFAALSRADPAEVAGLQPGQSPEKKLYDDVSASLSRPRWIAVLLVIATFVLAILALRSITQLHERMSNQSMSAQTNG